MINSILVLTVAVLILIVCCQQPAYSQMTAEVTETVWTLEIKTIPPVINVTVPPGSGPRDFVSITAPNAPVNDYSNYRYASAAVKGVLTFTNVKPGTYLVRYFELGSHPAPAPGKLVGSTLVTVPVPKPRKSELTTPADVVITRRATDTNGDIFIRITDDETKATALIDKSDTLKVNKPKITVDDNAAPNTP